LFQCVTDWWRNKFEPAQKKKVKKKTISKFKTVSNFTSQRETLLSGTSIKRMLLQQTQSGTNFQNGIIFQEEKLRWSMNTILR
jgi:hypothetical protein